MCTVQVYMHHYTASLSQGYVLGTASACRKGKWNLNSKDRGGCEDPLITWVQLKVNQQSYLFDYLSQQEPGPKNTEHPFF